jgi:hypothetical protein
MLKNQISWQHFLARLLEFQCFQNLLNILDFRLNFDYLKILNYFYKNTNFMSLILILNLR